MNNFYSQIARECGLTELSFNQCGIARRLHNQAKESFYKKGATVPPCSNLIGQVAWLITQKELGNENNISGKV